MKKKGKLIKDISASGLQTLINQVISLVIFYFTSRFLSKDDFGNFNWYTALVSTIIAIASLGIDLVVVKRIAAASKAYISICMHFFHNLFMGLFLVLISYLLYLAMPNQKMMQVLFLLVFINLSVANIGNTFKICLNGFEAYKELAYVSVTANILKLIGLIVLLLTNHFSVHEIVLVYTFCSLIELIIANYFANKHFEHYIKPQIQIKEYKLLIQESLPQFAVVLFDSALARIDWILLGIISTALATAEYSFAYRIFELSRLPILIVAPILLTRFSKLFVAQNTLSTKHKNEINVFLQFGLFISMLIPIFMIGIWSPVIDLFTNNKYGQVNEVNFMVLAFCVPLHFLTNFLWTLGFVQSQTKQIMLITIFSSITNIIFNAVLIKQFASFGASVSFLLSTLIQVLLYLRFINHSQINFKQKGIVFLIFVAIVSIYLSKLIVVHYLIQTAIALGLYILISLVSRLSNYKAVLNLFKATE